MPGPLGQGDSVRFATRVRGDTVHCQTLTVRVRVHARAPISIGFGVGAAAAAIRQVCVPNGS